MSETAVNNVSVKNDSKVKSNDNNTSKSALPTAVLKRIFKFLPGKEIYRCRRICKTWKKIVDDIISKDEKWRKYCKKEFKNNYKHARKNATGLNWFNLYKSLTLWSNIKEAKITYRLFDLKDYTHDFVTVDSFQIFDNKIGVHINEDVDYFELDTEKKLEHRIYNDIFSKYRENDKIVAVINIYTSRLLICPKEGEFNRVIDFQESFLEVDTNVKDFVLVDLKVYYITESGDLYVCKITDDLKDAKKNFLKQFEGNFLSLSFTNNINILTENYEIYSLIDNEFKIQCTYTNGQSLFNSILKYNFLDNIKWNDMYKYIVSKHNESEESVGIMWNVSAMMVYGKILLVGTENGHFSIYMLSSNDNLNLLTMRPVKDVNIFDIIKEKVQDNENSVHDVNEMLQMNIVHIDVVEKENGHNIYVATKSNVVVLELRHDYNKRTSSEIDLVEKKAKVSKNK